MLKSEKNNNLPKKTWLLKNGFHVIQNLWEFLLFMGHESMAVVQTVKMFAIVHTGKKCNRGCLK